MLFPAWAKICPVEIIKVYNSYLREFRKQNKSDGGRDSSELISQCHF